MSTTRYEQYKDSGVEWLGNVPSHWRVDRLKASIQTCRNGIWGEEALGDESDIPCVRVADFDRRRLRVELSEPTIRNVTEKERVGRVLRKGDLLLEKSGGGENQPVGCVVLFDDARPAVCSNFVARMVAANGQNSSYWRYVHAAAYAIRLTVGSINQTSGIQNLDQARYFNEYAVFPPQPEQAAIAAFLDRETAKIDALVEEQRRLIELLKEKRQAVISQAVTKGLNLDVPMKDSGVDWLGKVPQAWTVRSLRTLSSVVRGASPRPAGDPKFFDGDHIPWVTVAEITKDALTELTETDTCLTEAGAEHSRLFRSGTVIYSNSGATLGVPKILRVDACANDGVVGFESLSDLVEPIFLHHYLSSLTTTIRDMVRQGSGQPNLNTGLVKAIPIALPSRQEQLAICSHIEEVTMQFDRLSTEAEEAMKLLQERRSALISAAVTGKIDVRGLLPPPEAVAA